MSNNLPLRDRTSAGKQLAERIFLAVVNLRLAGKEAKPIVYALPRGGIPVAAPIAQQLGCPLDIVVAKKITLPSRCELAIGAVSSDGHLLWYSQEQRAHQDQPYLQIALKQTQKKAQDQLALFAAVRPQINPQGNIAIIVDDGIATGMTIAAAVKSIQQQQPQYIWLCAPVAPREMKRKLRQWGNRTFILATPHPFLSVSRFYEEFPQVSNQEALAYLEKHNQGFMANL